MPDPDRHEADERVVEAIGKASEALEYVERARGHLYSFHQLMGRADIEFGNASEMLADCVLRTEADTVSTTVVGRNVLDGRWTFQVVDEFDDLYYTVARDVVRDLERDHLDGRRHVYERRMKSSRRSPGEHGHDLDPPVRD
jgi:hypothetical protein